MGYRDIPILMEKIGSMEDSLPTPLKPIILRHREYSNWPGYQLFGLYSSRTFKRQGMNGQVVFNTQVDSTMPAYFYRDKNNVQYAVVPDCEHNRAVLTDPQNVRLLLMPTKANNIPLLTIVEAPKDLLDLIEERKKAPVPKVEKPKVMVGDGKDPFAYVEAKQKMYVDGEADHKN
jgi:hypothetical protein